MRCAVWWCAIRRLTPVLFVVLFVFSVLPTSGKGSQAGSAPRPTRQIPFVKVDPADLDRLPDGERIRERHVARQATSAQRWSTIHQLLGPRQVSRKSHALLRQRGLGPALLTKSAPVPGLVAAATPDDPDTLKVLLVRIGFESDVSGDLTSVTTDGDFRLEADPAIRIDPPPHNRAFYESHLNGLSEFYHYQSGGRLEIEYRVLPEAANECYKLSDIADYGPGEDGFWSIDSLGQLVVDMITTTDEQTQADGSVSLADYDDDDPFTYVIFVHAGSDWQSDVNQDSPNDIPTFFVTLGDTIAPDLTSIDSDTGTPGFLSECSVIPETTSQDGYTNDEGEYVPYVGSIAAALYHEFGHALGLVDLYNTATGLPTVGIWDLMDSGTNLSVVVGFEIPDTDPVEYDIIPVVGLLPPSLGAWDKWFLGWVKLADVDNRDALYQLPAVQVMREEYDLFDGVAGDFFSADPQVLVAGASPDEFFLIENRWVPPDPSATPFGELVFEADDSTGVVMYLAGELDGDYRNSGLYDYFLPAGGLLVWHVNMDRVNANLEYNLVNAWGDGVRLVEADGLQDVGVLDAYVLGWYGSERDPFSADFGYDELFTDGFPNSRAYDRSWTGISLRGISATGGVMSFSAGIEPLLPGWPFQVASVDAAEAAVAGGQATARAIDPASLTVFPTGSSETLVFADGPGVDWTGDLYPAKLFALDVAGDSRFPAVADLPTGAFAALTAPLAGPPAVVTMENDVETLVLGAQDGWLHSYFYDTTSETMALLWSTSVGDSLAFAPQIGTDSDGSYYLLCAVPPRSVAVYDEDGQPVGAPLALINDTGGAIAGFVAPPTRIERANAGDRWAVFSPGGWTLVDVTAGGPVAPYARHTHHPPARLRRPPRGRRRRHHRRSARQHDLRRQRWPVHRPLRVHGRRPLRDPRRRHVADRGPPHGGLTRRDDPPPGRGAEPGRLVRAGVLGGVGARRRDGLHRRRPRHLLPGLRDPRAQLGRVLHLPRPGLLGRPGQPPHPDLQRHLPVPVSGLAAPAQGFTNRETTECEDHRQEHRGPKQSVPGVLQAPVSVGEQVEHGHDRQHHVHVTAVDGGFLALLHRRLLSGPASHDSDDRQQLRGSLRG